MFCKKCGKEFNNSDNVCSYCGEENKNLTNEYELNNEREITNKKYSSITLILVFIILSLLTFAFLYTKSPEYTIYSAVSAMKDNDYEKTIKYININKIVNNRIDILVNTMQNIPGLNNNPYFGLAYLFIDAVKPKLISLIEEKFKSIVESPDNVFHNISKPQIFLFTLIKKYNDLSLVKLTNEDKKVVFEFSNKKIKNLRIVLVKNSDNKWEIVDIDNYYFWLDTYSNYLEHSK